MVLEKLSDDQILNITENWFNCIEHIMEAYGSYIIPKVEYERLCKSYLDDVLDIPINSLLETEGLSKSKESLERYLLVSELKDLCTNRKYTKSPLTPVEELYVSLKITLVVLGNETENMQHIDVIASCLCKRKPIVSKLID